MPYVIRNEKEIISAVKNWLLRIPRPRNEVMMWFGDMEYTIDRMLLEVDDPNSPVYGFFVWGAQQLAKQHGKDPLDIINQRG